jgi:hypothetical protein
VTDQGAGLVRVGKHQSDAAVDFEQLLLDGGKPVVQIGE